MILKIASFVTVLFLVGYVLIKMVLEDVRRSLEGKTEESE